MKRLLIAVILTLSGMFGSFISPFYGLCIYIWFAYMRAQEWAWGAGWFMAMRPSLTLALCVIGGAIIHGEKIFRKNRISMLVIFLWIIMFISFLNASDHDTALYWFDYISKVIILGCVIGGQVNSKKRLVTVVMILIVTIGYYSGKCGLFGILNPSEKILQGPGGMLGDNNEFALTFNMMLPFFYFGGELITDQRHKKYKVALRILFYLSILGVIFTYSRGGFLGLIAVILMINYRSEKKFTSVIVTVMFAAMIVLFFTPEAYKDRVSTINDSEEERDNSVKGRIHFWKVAISIANDNPLFGVGPQCYSDVYNRYDTSGGYFGTNRAVHNSFFQMLADNGYIAFGLYVSLIIISIRTCQRLRKYAKPREDLSWIVNCANIFEISLIGFCVSGFFLSLAYGDLVYHLFFIISSFNELAYSYLTATGKQTPEQAPVKTVPAIG